MYGCLVIRGFSSECVLGLGSMSWGDWSRFNLRCLIFLGALLLGLCGSVDLMFGCLV